jgi:hypothetical protein
LPPGLHCVTIRFMTHRRPINGEDIAFSSKRLSTTYGWAVTLRRAPRQSIERATFLVFLAKPHRLGSLCLSFALGDVGKLQPSAHRGLVGKS